jgi:hypothetical protein
MVKTYLAIILNDKDAMQIDISTWNKWTGDGTAHDSYRHNCPAMGRYICFVWLGHRFKPH